MAPVVPRYGQAPVVGPRVAPDPYPNVPAGPQASPEAFGNMQPGPALDLSGPQRASYELWQQARQRANQVATLDAENRLHSLTQDLYYHPQTGAFNVFGKDAIGAADKAHEAWTKGVDEITNSLTNQDQRDAFLRRAQGQRFQVDEQAAQHVNAQITQYDTTETEKALDARRAIAVSSTDKPAAIQQALDEQRAIWEDYAKAHGLGPEATKQGLASLVSQTHAAVVEQMLAQGNDLTAQAYFQQHQGDIIDGDNTKITAQLDVGSLRGESQRQADLITSGRIDGLLTHGTLDLTRRPRFVNADGSVSTVRSFSVEIDGKEVLLPSVSPDGKDWTEDQAIAHYRQTGEHLGIFADAASASAYAQQLHDAQAAMLEGRGNGTVPSGSPTLSQALARANQIANPKLRDETVRRVKAFYADQEDVKRADAESAFQEAGTILEQKGSYDAIPPALVTRMTFQQREYLRNRQDQIRKQQSERQTDAQVYYNLMNMSAINDFTRRDFESLNLLDPKIRSKLSDADLEYFVKLQRQQRLQTQGALAGEARRQASVADKDAGRLAGLRLLLQSKTKPEDLALMGYTQDEIRAAQGTAAASPGAAASPVPGGPIQPPTATQPSTGAPAAPSGPAPTLPSGLPVPQSWLDRAARNPNYRLYLQHMGVRVP